MLTFRDTLAGLNAYPIPPRTLMSIGVARGLDLDAEATKDSINGTPYRLAYADVMMWLADAPNIAQGGQNYSFTDEQRTKFRAEAQSIYEELEPESLRRVKYGYKGSRL